jgi:hypothetical protein
MELDGSGADRLEKLSRERWLMLVLVKRIYGRCLRQEGRLQCIISGRDVRRYLLRQSRRTAAVTHRRPLKVRLLCRA